MLIKRWKQSLNIMIKKEKNNSKHPQLRSIQLFEEDFDFFLETVFGDRLMGFATKYCVLNKSQYGSRARTKYSLMIYSELQKDGAYAEFDAVTNYDCMIPTLVVLMYNRLGLGNTPGRMLLDALEKMIHCVRASHGDSNAIYRDELLHGIFGTGQQGSGVSSHFWIAVSEVILTKELDSFTCNNPTRMLVSTRNKFPFVDNSGLVVDDIGGDVVGKLKEKSQLHEKYLHVTGGKLAQPKCFWTLNGSGMITRYVSSSMTPARTKTQG